MIKNGSIFWALALSIGIFACSDVGTDDSRGAREEQRELRVYCWGEYFSPEAIEAFTQKTGITVRQIEFMNADEMVASMHSQPDQYDIVTVDGTALRQLKELSLLKRLDPSRLRNLGNLNPHSLDQAGDRDEMYSVPFLTGTTLIAYRKDKIPDIRRSWNALFDPEYKGRIAMLDEFADNFAAALLASGLPMNSSEALDIKVAKERLFDQVKNLDVRVGAYADILEALQTGEIWAALNYSGDVAVAALENPNIDFFIPEEGAILWTDSLVVSRDTQAMDAAYKFLDFMLEGEIAAKNANYMHLASPNSEAAPFMDAEVISDSRIYLSQEVLDRSSVIQPYKDSLHAARLDKVKRDFEDTVRELNAFLNQPGEGLAQTRGEKGGEE